MKMTDKISVRYYGKLAAVIDIFQIFYTVGDKSSGLP